MNASSWAICGGIIFVAIAGNLVGSMLAARWTGASWHDAFVLGALMNTRGLMELIALNVGYDLGILSSSMLTMLVIMALLTTVMTSPLIDLASMCGGAPMRRPRPRCGADHAFESARAGASGCQNLPARRHKDR